MVFFINKLNENFSYYKLLMPFILFIDKKIVIKLVLFIIQVLLYTVIALNMKKAKKICPFYEI